MSDMGIHRRNDSYDILILGAGSAAFAAALKAEQLGKIVLMVENRVIGGT